jgi:hypothetical protein
VDEPRGILGNELRRVLLDGWEFEARRRFGDGFSGV